MNTRTGFQEELNKLRQDILAMAAMVEEDVGKAICALKNNDLELAQKVKENDTVINAMQINIEDKAAILIATQQPVARDLRELVTFFKITTSLERAGDHAVHLAKAAIKLKGKQSLFSIEHLEKMAKICQEMIHSAINAFLSHDTESARLAASLDNKIDEEHKILVEKILNHIKKEPKLIKKAIRILNTSNYLERLGDHITNICEGIIYIVEGRHEELND